MTRDEFFGAQVAATTAAKHVPQPKTPSRHAHNEINGIVAAIENKWQLGLVTRDVTWSPSCSARRTNHDRCYARIKFLYFQARPVLDEIRLKFDATAESKPPTERLGYLWELLDKAHRSATKKSFRRSTSFQERLRRQTPLQQRLHDAASPDTTKARTLEAQHSSLSRRTEADIITSSPEDRLETTRSINRFASSPEAVVTTQPNTPTVEDDGRFATPPLSPTLAASFRKQSQLGDTISIANLGGSNAQSQRRGKRRSDESIQQERSQKLCRTSEPKVDHPFAMPDQPTTRGRSNRQSVPAVPKLPSATTSFSSTTTVSRSESVFSQYRSATTANTSFATTNAPSQGMLSQKGEPFHSSGSFSLDGDPDLLHLISKHDNPSIPDMDGMSGRRENHISPGKSMEQHQIKNLPYQGLFVPDMAGKLRDMPFKYRWEFTRIALANGLDPQDLLPDETYHDYNALWVYFQNQCKKLPRMCSTKAWDAAEDEYKNVKLKGVLTFNSSNTGPLFKLTLEALRMEASCRFQRAFGGDRFLFLEMPPMNENNMPRHFRRQHENLSVRIQEWLLEPKRFLGRTWRVFHYEDIKKKKSLRRPAGDMGGRRLVLFATEGCDILPKHGKSRRRIKYSSSHPAMNIQDLINWFMDLDLNSKQTFAKAFARISLGLTTTNPGLPFEPSQVIFTDDINSDNTPEKDPYRDSTIECPYGPIHQQVMNDGCSRISVGAARLLWRELKQSGPLPSAYQGRIGGAKGVWMLSAPTDTQDPHHLRPWIEVTESQSKFKLHKEDLIEGANFDPHRWMFDLHSVTGPASSSSLYLSFFPILLDRGVSAAVLQRIFQQYLDRERTSILDAIEDPVRLRRWVSEQNDKMEERNREGDMFWMAGMPCQLQERIIFLLESGFSPCSPVLCTAIQRLVARSLKWLRQSARIPLARCTYLKGVADPTGTLVPGEIHLFFSHTLSDDISGESYSFLDNRPVLVARNPALRRSDIQKVRASFKPELTFLRDVVVFSSKGSYPLAGKLQGGDYDGDDFWVCWDPDLVDPFKNAPAPIDPPDPERYGIQVDKRTLGDLLRSSSSIDSFLKESFNFRSKASMLGVATQLHGKVSYYENSIDSPNVNALADLHDLLVDASKSGFIFDDSAFMNFKKHHLKIPAKVVQPRYQPAYKAAQEKDLEINLNAKGQTKKLEYKRDNIMDKLYFETIEPHTAATMKILTERLAKPERPDPSLMKRYLLESKGDDAEIKTEIKRLEKSLSEVLDLWNKRCRSNDKAQSNFFEKSFYQTEKEMVQDGFANAEAYDATVEECFTRYSAITFLNRAHPVMRRWNSEHDASTPTEWSLLKASTLYTMFVERHTFVFQMAGRELAWLKACSMPGTRAIVQDMWANMKPRRIQKAIVAHVPEVIGEVLSDTEVDEDEFATAPEAEDGEDLSVLASESPQKRDPKELVRKTPKRSLRADIPELLATETKIEKTSPEKGRSRKTPCLAM